MLTRRLCFIIASAALLLGTPRTASAVPCPAAPFVTTAGQAIISAARRKSATAFSGIASRYGDMRGLAMFALGPHRGKLAPSREREYVSLTNGYIGRFLARHSQSFAASGLTVVSCSGQSIAPVVTTRLSTGDKVVFRLYKTRRGYLMRDVNISSVWLGQQLRSTFTGIINRRNGDIGALFAFLRG